MEHVTPTHLAYIFGAALLVMGSAVVAGYWPEIVGVFHRYVHVRLPTADADNEPDEPEIASNNNATTTQQPVAMPQTGNNELLLLQGQARALAALVAAGKVGQTEGIKMVFQVSPSSTGVKYNAAKEALQAELARLERGGVDYPDLSQEQAETRQALGLE